VRAIRRKDGDVFLDRSAPEPRPERGPDAADPLRLVLVRPTLVAIGAADVALARGEQDAAHAPNVLGHQFVGVVEDAGAGSRFKRGTRVGASIDIACTRCDMCRSGLSAHCRERRVLGLQGWDGCLADRVLVPEANLCEVPAGLEDARAVLALPLATALHAARVTRVEGRPYVTVLGDGLIGLLAAQALARMNASVRVLGDCPARFSLAERWGVKHRHVDEVGRRQDQDLIVLASDDARMVEIAPRLVRPRGMIVALAGPGAASRGPELDLGPVMANELQVVGARGGSVPEALSALARGDVETASLMGRRFRLDDGVAALRAASDPDAGVVLVEV
jgi:threonine dehydrogenase-like Zn-dependent dehydrogenase